MKLKFIITCVFSILYFSGTQYARAEGTGKNQEKIQPAAQDILLTKSFLEKKFDLASGKKLYASVGCAACHDNEVMGAPKLGDKKAWASRISHGWDQIFKHSMFDFNNMPAKGGNSALTEKDIENICAYMVSLVLNG